MDQSCAICGEKYPPGFDFCPRCGKKEEDKPKNVTSGDMAENLAAMVCYILIVPAIIFLCIEPYNKSRFIRFHAWQSILFHILYPFLLFLFLFIAGLVFRSIWLMIAVLAAWPILWIICMIAAYGHERFRLPLIAGLAEQWAGY